MEDLIEMIRAASATGASDETRAAGAHACRTLLSALEANPGEPMASATTPVAALASSSRPQPHAAVQAIVSAVRGMTPDQLLDLAIAKLRARLPASDVGAPARPLHLRMVSVDGLAGGRA